MSWDATARYLPRSEMTTDHRDSIADIHKVVVGPHSQVWSRKIPPWPHYRYPQSCHGMPQPGTCPGLKWQQTTVTPLQISTKLSWDPTARSEVVRYPHDPITDNHKVIMGHHSLILLPWDILIVSIWSTVLPHLPSFKESNKTDQLALCGVCMQTTTTVHKQTDKHYFALLHPSNWIYTAPHDPGWGLVITSSTANIPGENLMSEISSFRWWKDAISSMVSEFSTTKLPETKRQVKEPCFNLPSKPVSKAL